MFRKMLLPRLSNSGLYAPQIEMLASKLAYNSTDFAVV